jgi:hypothetical protein
MSTQPSQPSSSTHRCGPNEALVISRVARRNRWLVRAWAIAAIAASACAAANLVAAANLIAGGKLYLPLLTGLVGFLSGAVALPAIRFAKANAEDADVFQLLTSRLQDSQATESELEVSCKQAWEYIEGKLQQARG